MARVGARFAGSRALDSLLKVVRGVIMEHFKYGLTLHDIEIVDKKISKQINFLKEFILDFGDGAPISLLDSSMSANINPKKYFAEVNNRVNSLFEYSKQLGLYPVFLTITLPDRFHPSSKNYDSSLSVRDGVRHLSDSWRSFRNLKVFSQIKKKTGHNPIYLKVIEPHKSGVPHVHVMLFLPKNFILSMKQIFKRHFSRDGASKYAQDFKYTWSNTSGGAVAYLLKYINKTFKNALEDKMTMEAYYFARHRIIRFTCSRVLVPLYIHRKIKHDPRFRDFLTCTDYYHSGVLYSAFNKKFVLFIDDPNEADQAIYAKNPMIDDLFKKSKTWVPDRIVKHREDTRVPIFIDGKKSSYVFQHKRIYEPVTAIYDYSDWNLLEYYRSLDPDLCDFNHFINVRNLCVSRGLIDSDPLLTQQLFGFDDYKNLCSFS